jgi:hypothetical protein
VTTTPRDTKDAGIPMTSEHRYTVNHEADAGHQFQFDQTPLTAQVLRQKFLR